jgi:biotin carboxyl carrier protein
LNIRSKRVNFIAIQASHAIACKGYHQFTVRTGYDGVVADRTFDLFAYTAKQSGKVISLDDKGIIIEYDNKQTTGYELGRRFGAAAGLTIPHQILTPLKLNDKVNVGDCIVYNDGFFEPDFFNPKNVVLKNATNVKTVLWESHQTLEDASSISSKVADKLSTKVTKVKNIIVGFDQSVSKLVKVGDIVSADSILCFIEDGVTANNNLFNDTSIDTLRTISAQAPKALVKGVVEKIDIFYHGDKEDMSESLKSLANNGDKELKSKAKSLGTKEMTGSVDSGLRIDNDPVALDNLVIRIYITSNVGAGIGD